MSDPARVGEILPGVLADLAHAARLTPAQLAAWLAEVERTGGCRNPVHIVGERLTVDTQSGEVLHRYSTDDEPLGRLALRCGTRRESRCPPCSKTYKADAFHIIHSGLAGGKDVPASVAVHPRVFATLTAPSFGPVHSRVVNSDRVQRCYPRGKTGGPSCVAKHAEDDPLLGQPIDSDSYDYTGAVLWNAHAPMLWARFTIELRRSLARLAGVSQRRLSEHLRVTCAKAAEYQRRGLVHFHAVIRVDGPDPDQLTPPPSWATVQLLEHAIRDAAQRVAVTTPATVSADAMQVRWGQQLDIRPIAAFGPGQQLTDLAVAAYIAKYATKAAETTGTIDRPLWCRHCNGAGIHEIPHHPEGLRCRPCAGTGLRDPKQGLDLPEISEHARQMIRTCWQLANHPELAPRNLRRWAHMLGFGGHFLSKSRRYSISFSQLRETRTKHARETATELDGTPEPHGDTVLVLNHWRYAGTGPIEPGLVLGGSIEPRAEVLPPPEEVWPP
jgi:Replication initiator protein, pSAM2